MRIQDDTLVKLLEQGGVATETQLAPLKEEAARQSRPLQDVVIEAKLITEADLTKRFAEYADIPYIEIEICQDLIATCAGQRKLAFMFEAAFGDVEAALARSG